MRAPVGGQGCPEIIPDPFDPNKKRKPTMLTTDLSLRFDPIYEPISRALPREPGRIADAFARARFKLTHRDMGPIARYLGPLVPKEQLIWQDPIPERDHPVIDDADIASLKRRSSARLFRIGHGVSVAWASAATYRSSDKRGGMARAFASLRRRTGKSTTRRCWRRCCRSSARYRLQRLGHRWQEGFHGRPDRAGRLCGHREGRAGWRRECRRTFHPGRMDALEEWTDAQSFEALRPVADGFRNYYESHFMAPEEALVDKGAPVAPERTWR